VVVVVASVEIYDSTTIRNLGLGLTHSQKLTHRKRIATPLIYSMVALFLIGVGLDLNTPPSRLGLDIWCVKFAGLDICG
jgi:hypothetical protein